MGLVSRERRIRPRLRPRPRHRLGSALVLRVAPEILSSSFDDDGGIRRRVCFCRAEWRAEI